MRAMVRRFHGNFRDGMTNKYKQSNGQTAALNKKQEVSDMANPAEQTAEEKQFIHDLRFELLKSETLKNDLPMCDAIMQAILMAMEKAKK